MKVYDVIKSDLGDDPIVEPSGNLAKDQLDLAFKYLVRERCQEAIETAEKASELAQGDDAVNERAMAGLIVALTRITVTYKDVEPLLLEAAQMNPYGLGSLAEKVMRWKADLR